LEGRLGPGFEGRAGLGSGFGRVMSSVVGGGGGDGGGIVRWVDRREDLIVGSQSSWSRHRSPARSQVPSVWRVELDFQHFAALEGSTCDPAATRSGSVSPWL
jgi:hypothetical protein